MSRTRSILIVTFGFAGGLWGSGRLLSDLVRYVDRKQYRITILVLTERISSRAELPQGIALIGNDYFSTTVRKLVGMLVIWRFCWSHDFIVSYPELTPTYMTIFASSLAFKRAVGGVHVHLSTVFRYALRPAAHRKLISFLYPCLRRTIAVSNGVAEDLREQFGLRNVVSVPNSIDLDRIQRMACEEIPANLAPIFSNPVLMSIGMLVFQKGHDILLHAFQRVKEAGYPHHLVIVGTGRDLQKLKLLIRELNLDNTVHLIGHINNPYPLMKRSDLFVLSSRYEGFGLVLAEALALGVPVVSTDCNSGPREILANGRCGVLVPVDDPDALARGIIRVLSDGQLAEAMRFEGLREVQQRDAKLWSAKFIEAIVCPAHHFDNAKVS